MDILLVGDWGLQYGVGVCAEQVEEDVASQDDGDGEYGSEVFRQCAEHDLQIFQVRPPCYHTCLSHFQGTNLEVTC